MKSLVAMLALALAFPGHAAAHPAPRAVAADARADVEKLIGILASQDDILDLGGRALEYGVNQGDLIDPELRKVYDAHPGMKEYVTGKVRPEFQAILSRALPDLRRDLGAIVTAEMTAGEIADTLAFFSSPTGIKMKAQIYRSIGDRPDRTQAEMQQSIVDAAMTNLTPDDYPALMAFGTSSAAQKMQSVTPKISAASQSWTAQMIAANEARLRKLAAAATAEFLAKSK
ncbi:hypothetical protein IAG41_18690 [Sphingomonas sp. JC676]|uniref:hypothetical protein n=1 Tax=Sphingomonas sp. JC676 TaxID=2768065 RepID=UPI001657D858|nr:hypothetical protein [Sphingomonas sp. JC676]MBC9034420.1 hypothetical protein [Sphingomonas sp. JC676]